MWLILLALCGCATTTGASGGGEALHFIEDDYAAALQEARSRDVPLFVDAWAPWCHSCVFLKQHVLRSPELASESKRYVFLSVNTELAQSAAFLEKYPVDVWPTLFIVEPKSEKAVLKWLGTGTVEQLSKLLDDGEAAAHAEDGSLLAKADRLYAARSPEAPDAYRAAFEALPKDHPRRGRALESLLNAQYRAKQYDACTDAALANAPAMPRGPSFVNVVSLGLSCAMESKRGLDVLEPLAVESLKLDGILADDTSGLYDTLVDLRSERKEDVKALGREWLSFLEAQAAKAPTPAARAVFDSHRLAAALAAGEPLRAEGALKQSEQDFPDDYNPAARLAVVYREVGRYDEALSTLERAFAKVYGPRKLRLYETKASILEKKGDKAGQKAAFIEAVKYAEALPASQRNERVLASLKETLAKLQ
jgi:thioredoxin-like negative regulator of GroEL